MGGKENLNYDPNCDCAGCRCSKIVHMGLQELQLTPNKIGQTVEVPVPLHLMIQLQELVRSSKDYCSSMSQIMSSHSQLMETMKKSGVGKKDMDAMKVTDAAMDNVYGCYNHYSMLTNELMDKHVDEGIATIITDAAKMYKVKL